MPSNLNLNPPQLIEHICSCCFVQVAVRVNSKSVKKLRSGDTVEYVICEDGSGLPATQRAYHVDEVRERKDELKIDIK